MTTKHPTRIWPTWYLDESIQSLRATLMHSFLLQGRIFQILSDTDRTTCWNSPCCPTSHSRLWRWTQNKALASAKAPVWVTVCERTAVQTSGIVSEVVAARAGSLWETPRSAPPAWTWTSVKEREPTVDAGTLRARSGPRQKGLGSLGRRWGKEEMESRGRKGRRICCGLRALAAASFPGQLHWWRSAGHNAGGRPTPPLGFWLSCRPPAAPLLDAPCSNDGEQRCSKGLTKCFQIDDDEKKCKSNFLNNCSCKREEFHLRPINT